jgi:hypothetical protein
MPTQHLPNSRPNQNGELPWQARQRVSRHGAVALIGMLAPAILFPGLLWLARRDSRFDWVVNLHRAPWELWGLAFCGGIATIGGIADWLFHRSGETAVGIGEHRSHVAALVGGGLPLFSLMLAASIMKEPQRLLIPIVLVVIGTTVLICYDEFVFHRRRCNAIETLMHRLLVFGNMLAWLAWMHWCFARGASSG